MSKLCCLLDCDGKRCSRGVSISILERMMTTVWGAHKTHRGAEVDMAVARLCDTVFGGSLNCS